MNANTKVFRVVWTWAVRSHILVLHKVSTRGAVQSVKATRSFLNVSENVPLVLTLHVIRTYLKTWIKAELSMWPETYEEKKRIPFISEPAALTRIILKPEDRRSSLKSLFVQLNLQAGHRMLNNYVHKHGKTHTGWSCPSEKRRHPDHT